MPGGNSYEIFLGSPCFTVRVSRLKGLCWIFWTLLEFQRLQRNTVTAIAYGMFVGNLIKRVGTFFEWCQPCYR